MVEVQEINMMKLQKKSKDSTEMVMGVIIFASTLQKNRGSGYKMKRVEQKIVSLKSG